MWVAGWELGEVVGNVGRRDFPDTDDEWCVAVSVCVIVVEGQFILFYYYIVFEIMRILYCIVLYCIIIIIIIILYYIILYIVLYCIVIIFFTFALLWWRPSLSLSVIVMSPPSI